MSEDLLVRRSQTQEVSLEDLLRTAKPVPRGREYAAIKLRIEDDNEFIITGVTGEGELMRLHRSTHPLFPMSISRWEGLGKTIGVDEDHPLYHGQGGADDYLAMVLEWAEDARAALTQRFPWVQLHYQVTIETDARQKMRGLYELQDVWEEPSFLPPY